MKKSNTRRDILKNLKAKMKKQAQKNKVSRKRHITCFGM